MRLFSHIISGMFHPLLMVTYGVVLLSPSHIWQFIRSMKLLLAGERSLSTAVIPGAIYLYDGKKRGGGRYGAIGQT